MNVDLRNKYRNFREKHSESFIEFNNSHQQIYNNFPTVEFSEEDIKEGCLNKGVRNFWELIEVLFEDHLIIQFIDKWEGEHNKKEGSLER